MLREEVVSRRHWLSDEYFLDLVGATNLIPGPNSTEMVIHVGYLRAGWRGLIVAGACFILPAATMVLALAWAYVQYGSTPAGESLLYGIKPVIIAVIAQALWGLGRTAIKGPLLMGAVVRVEQCRHLAVEQLVSQAWTSIGRPSCCPRSPCSRSSCAAPSRTWPSLRCCVWC